MFKQLAHVKLCAKFFFFFFMLRECNFAAVEINPLTQRDGRSNYHELESVSLDRVIAWWLHCNLRRSYTIHPAGAAIRPTRTRPGDLFRGASKVSASKNPYRVLNHANRITATPSTASRTCWLFAVFSFSFPLSPVWRTRRTCTWHIRSISITDTRLASAHFERNQVAYRKRFAN